MARKFNDHNVYKIFVVDNGQLVAKMEVECGPRRIVRHIDKLYGVYIKPSHQKMGVGIMLWTQVEKVANTKGLEQFWLDVISTNRSAIKFYGKMKFQTLCKRKKSAKVNGVYYDKIFMERFL